VLYTPDDTFPKHIMTQYDKEYKTTSKAISSLQEMDDYYVENDCLFGLAFNYYKVSNFLSIKGATLRGA